MAKRLINAYDVLQGWIKTWKPDCVFEGKTRKDYERWRKAFAQHYRECLGEWPRKVPLRLKVVKTERKRDHIRYKIIYDSSPGVTVPAYLLVPKGLKKGERRPGILAAHGHGSGKVDITGVTLEHATKEQKQSIVALNYCYALAAVRRGYVVIAPDWCPFGERRPPDEWSRVPGRDPCNVTNMGWSYFGRPLLTQNVWDGMRAVDVLTKHPHVDPRRIGVIGLSYGGTMSTHLLINERRIKAGVVSGYISTVRTDALNMRGKGNTCGAQHVPRLLLHGDVADALGLAVPKPVLFEMGVKETCFHYPDMIKAWRHLKTIYDAAGYPERIGKDVHPNDHMWSGRLAWDWLEKWL